MPEASKWDKMEPSEEKLSNYLNKYWIIYLLFLILLGSIRSVGWFGKKKIRK